jgi:hypothetical protein
MTQTQENTMAFTNSQIHAKLDELVDATEPGVNGFIQAFRMLCSPDFINSLPESYLLSLSDSERSLQALIYEWASYLRDRKKQQALSSVTIFAERNSFNCESIFS